MYTSTDLLLFKKNVGSDRINIVFHTDQPKDLTIWKLIVMIPFSFYLFQGMNLVEDPVCGPVVLFVCNQPRFYTRCAQSRKFGRKKVGEIVSNMYDDREYCKRNCPHFLLVRDKSILKTGMVGVHVEQ